MYRKGRKKYGEAFPKNRNLKVYANFEFFFKERRSSISAETVLLS
jgi:hypothetical protein